MLPFKNLLLAAEAHLKDTHNSELEKAITQAREFLVSTKSFEYAGKITKPYQGTTIKLEGIKQDFDDVICALAGKRQNVEMEGYLCLVVDTKPIPVEVKQPEPTPPATDATPAGDN